MTIRTEAKPPKKTKRLKTKNNSYAENILYKNMQYNDCLHEVPWHQFTILFSAVQKNSSSSSLYTYRCRPNQSFDRVKLFHLIIMEHRLALK